MAYNNAMTLKNLRIILWVVAAIAVVAFGYAQLNKKPSQNKNIDGIVAADFGGEFTLVNQEGKEVTDKDFENDYRLIYFGFTYCPAICPTELQRIAALLKSLGDVGDKITPIFITVDPERDTVVTMKNYVEQFHPRFIGLTGTPQQIDVVKKAYKIYAAKVKEEGMSDYTVDHSSFIYFMGPNNDLIRIFKPDDSQEEMMKIIRAYVK